MADQRPNRRTRAMRQLAARCDRLIADHYMNPFLDVTWLAAQLHVSTRSLYRVFAGTTGISGRIAHRRLDAVARTIAEDPSISVRDATGRAGYASCDTYWWQRRRYQRLGV